MTITSGDNPILKKVRKAIARGGLTDDGLAVAEGPHLLAEAIRSCRRVERVLVCEGTYAAHGDAVAPHVFREIQGTEHSQGVIALVEAPVWSTADIGRDMVLVLDAVQDPGNAGTMIRAAEALGASGVILLKGSVNPWNPKCLRAAAGSLFRMPVCYGVVDLEAWADLQWIAAVGTAQETIAVVDFTRPTLVLIGNEGSGVRADFLARSRSVRIPTQGVESLNAAVAASILLYEAARQRACALTLSSHREST